MKKKHKILGGILIVIILILSTLVLAAVLESVNLGYGTNSLVEYDTMEDLSADRTLTLNWSNNFTGYDGNGGAAEVVIAVYVPTDYGIDSTSQVTLIDNSDVSQGSNFQVYNVSEGNCTGLNAVAGSNVWSTNCTLIVINGTLASPTEGVGFDLNIDINLSDDCVTNNCVNESYEVMFSDLIVYKKLVNSIDSCNPETYNSSANTTYCYKVDDDNVNYSCVVQGNKSDPTGLSCNITKGIGTMYNSTDIMKQGTTGVVKNLGSGKEEFTIELKQGWNLISIPLTPENDSISAVLGPISEKYNQVTRFNSTSQASETYTYGAPSHLQPFTTMSPGVGYWILATEDVNLTIYGMQPQQTSIDIVTGWNLVGPLFLSKKAISSDALLSIDEKYNQVTRFNSTSQASETYTYGAPSHLQPFTTMSPGVGYWILAVENTTWTM